jgi:hypothetical protein
MAEQEPTFNWNGNPSYQEGNKLYYNSFMFCNVRYALGDFVYLLPEDEGAPLYIARLKQAYEDTNAAEGERLSIQVRHQGLPGWHTTRLAPGSALLQVLVCRTVFTCPPPAELSDGASPAGCHRVPTSGCLGTIAVHHNSF